MEAIERNIIAAYQGGIEICDTPFLKLSQAINCSEDDIVRSLKALLDDGIVTRFGPMYNADRMDRWISLVAMKCPVDQLDDVVKIINSYSEVAHNYERDNPLNLWFVLTTADASLAEHILAEIETRTGLHPYSFPKKREFFVGFQVPIEGHTFIANHASSCRLESLGQKHVSSNIAHPQLDDTDWRIINTSQAGLPVETRPFCALARNLGLAPEEVIVRFSRMLYSGIIRRVAVVPNHYRLGIKANGMTVWDIPDESIEEAGARLGSLPFVSHCYQRPRALPEWPYNLFAMIHGPDRSTVDLHLETMRVQIKGLYDKQDILFSRRILKKTGIRFGEG